MKIRLMNKNDLEEVRNLIYKSFGRKCQKSYNNTEYTFTIVAEIDAKICGMATVYVHSDDLIDEKDYYVSNLCVDLNYQRMGIATKIVEFIEEKGRKDNIKHIYTLVPQKYEETNKLYTKLNYDLKNINCFRKGL